MPRHINLEAWVRIEQVQHLCQYLVVLALFAAPSFPETARTKQVFWKVNRYSSPMNDSESAMP